MESSRGSRATDDLTIMSRCWRSKQAVELCRVYAGLPESITDTQGEASALVGGNASRLDPVIIQGLLDNPMECCRSVSDGLSIYGFTPAVLFILALCRTKSVKAFKFHREPIHSL